MIALRARTITSLIAALRSQRAFRGGAFLICSRMRSTISPARSASLTTQPSASLTSPRSGGRLSRKLQAARALLRALAIGCVISWASDAANSPIMLMRFLWAKADEPFFSPFTLAQIEHKRDSLVAVLLKQR